MSITGCFFIKKIFIIFWFKNYVQYIYTEYDTHIWKERITIQFSLYV